MKSDENNKKKKLTVNRKRSRLYQAPEENAAKNQTEKITTDHTPKATVQTERKPAAASKQRTTEKQSPENTPLRRQSEKTDNEETAALGADKVIQKYSSIAAGTGLIALPVLDIAMVIGTQVQLIKRLAEIYDIPFSATKAKPLLTGLLSGIGAHTLATGSLSSMLRFIPLFGPLLHFLVFPAAAGAATYAAGNVFQLHFKNGGTIDDFSVKYYKELFSQKYESRNPAKPHTK